MRRLGARPTALSIALFVAVAAWADEAAARPVRVIVPDGDSLQYLSFWVARGGGLFQAEGLEVDVVVPENPKKTHELVARGDAEVFVLPPPLAFELVGAGVPVVLVASLLERDPINVVVRRSVLAARNLSPSLPLAQRIEGLKGLTIGVAPGPPPRLRALLATAGLDAEKDIRMSILPGRMQNAAFGDGSVDALYAHTPYLENALLDQGGVLFINQSKGEVAALTAHQIHTLAVTRRLRDAEPDLVMRLVRGVAKAEALIHASRPKAVDAVLAQFPALDRGHVDLLVSLYEPAVPSDPRVSVEGLTSALAMFPASRVMPNLASVDLALHVDDTFARAASVAPRSTSRTALALAAVVTIAAGVVFAMIRVIVRLRRESARRAHAQKSLQ